MKRKTSALLVMLAVSALLLTAVAPALAQQDKTGTATETPTTTPTSTPTSTDSSNNQTTTTTTSTPSGSDDGPVHVTAGSDNNGGGLGGIVVNIGGDNKGNEIDTSQVVTNVGPNVVVHDYGYVRGEDKAWFEITVKRPSGVELAHRDVFRGLDSRSSSQKIVTGTVQSQKLDQGTYRIEVPATRYDGQARVTLGAGRHYATIPIDTPGEGKTFLDRFLQLKFALGGIGMFLTGIVLRVGYKFYRQQQTGEPETIDGVSVTRGTVGLKSEVGDDE